MFNKTRKINIDKNELMKESKEVFDCLVELLVTLKEKHDKSELK